MSQGRGFGDNSKTAQVKTLVPADAEALAEQPYVDGVTPSVTSSVTARFKDTEASATVNGVSEDFFYVKGMTLESGQPFDKEGVTERVQDVVIDNNTKNTFFSDGTNPVGQVILLGSLPSRIIGVIEEQKSMMGNSDSLNVYLPYSTVMSRMLGQSNVRNIIVRVKDEEPLKMRFWTCWFSVMAHKMCLSKLGQYSWNHSANHTNHDLTGFCHCGDFTDCRWYWGDEYHAGDWTNSRNWGTYGVGARQSDILQQFLIEAVLVCILGGVLGVLLSLGIGQLIGHFAGGTFQMAYSTTSIIAAFVCSSMIGIIFGFIPARNAAQLNPVDALSRE